MAAADKLNAKLQQSLLLNRPRQNDRLQLPDAILLAALNGSRPLRAAERQLLQASPLTLRRFQFLALQARQAQSELQSELQTELQTRLQSQWQRSSGQVLAAASLGQQAFQLVSSDQSWQLDVFPMSTPTAVADAVATSWQMLLRLHPSAPFASQLLQQACVVQVLDGEGNLLMEGELDSDAELQAPWPAQLGIDEGSAAPAALPPMAPLAYFASHGGSFIVQKRE